MPFVLEPNAWRARRVILLPQRLNPRPVLGPSWINDELTLSRTGAWVAVVSDAVAPDWAHGAWIFDVERASRSTRIQNFDDGEASQICFSPNEEAVAFLCSNNGSSIHIARLSDGREQSSWPLDEWFGETEWLRSGCIVVTKTELGGTNAGPRPKSLLRVINPKNGECVREVRGVQVVSVESRLGHEYRCNWGEVHICDSANGRVLATVPSGHAEQFVAFSNNLPAYSYQASPNFNHAFTTTETGSTDDYCVIDLNDGSRRNLQETPATFTRAGQLLTFAGLPLSVWSTAPEWQWLDDVPLVTYCYDFWQFDRVRAIDPASGAEFAHTTAVRGRIQRLALSQDGATMAVLTQRRIYLYDVPPGFR